MKSKQLLVSIIAAGLSLQTLPVFAEAEYDYVGQAEKQLKEFEKTNGKNNKDYYHYVFALAQAYLYVGKKTEADTTYKQSLALLEKHPDGERLKEIQKANWANALLFDNKNITQQDKEEAFSILKEQENAKDKSNVGVSAYISIAAVYLRAHEKKRLDALEAKMAAMIQKDTAKTGLNKNDIYTLSNVLLFLARLHLTNRNFLKRDLASTPEEFNKAAVHFAKALALCDKLPEKDSYRVQTYRDSINFYKINGKKEEADRYTKTLAKALGTSDPNILFPPRDPCPACGMG